MSSPSTPRSTRSASPAGNSPDILTPGQKIKAMMAAFDSDSESENNPTETSRPISKLDFGTKSPDALEPARSENSDDADEIVRPKGRMAARMQGDSSGVSTSESTEQSAFARLSNALRTEREQAQKPPQKSPAPEEDSSDDDDDDDFPTAAARRNKPAARHSPDADDQLPTRSRTSSPLFVSPTAPRHGEVAQDESVDEDGDRPKGNERFRALVAQKRKEREEREKIEAEKKAARRSQMEQFSSGVLYGEESGADDEGSGRKLSQKARQPRKASKKAMDEMHRETQRMSRNMQLAHEAQTKKKISKESFFARFNFMQPNAPVEQPAANSSSTAGSQNSSDGEAPNKTHDTPHTSPVLGPSEADKPATVETANPDQPGTAEKDNVDHPDLPALQGAIASAKDGSKSPKDSMIAPAVVAAAQADANIAKSKKEPFQMTRPPVRVLMSRHEVAQHQKNDSDSEDDLEVVTSPAKCRRIAAFENLPARQMQEPASMTKLKALAHLTSPTRKATSMNSAELSASLLYKARQQAAKDRRERIEELRAKGVVIETAEDRAAMEDDVEDLVEKARKEADDIARQEKAAKKKAQGLDEDDSDDDDYQFSGSDDDGSGNDDDDSKGVNDNPALFEQEANEADESSDNESEDAASEAESVAPEFRRKRPTRVVSDDEEEDEAQVPSTPVRPPSNAPQSAERPQFPNMGTPIMSIGLTQAFAGTLADGAGSQPGSATVSFSLPDPGRPVPRLHAEESEILVRDSQEQAQEPDFMAHYSQNVTRVSESPAGHRFSQFSQLPDPTQDEGFVFSPFDPAKRFRGTPPVSTIDTVIVSQSQSPVAERKGRHLRRGRAAELSTVEEGNDEGDFEINVNAFNVMKKASKKKKEAAAYDKKNSEAKGVVDEAAEESEDEYAGLGGGSDDSEGEEDALDQQMINDNSGEKVDEKQLAALNASHQRDRDEKDVAKLMKDITTGALRRRRGPDDDFDLDDSDDERLARRREKQREFAKMRRALLADDKVGELAENPKKAAFFKAIEDREVEDDFELDFLEEKEDGSQNESSQDVAPEAPTEGQDSSAQDSKKRKRPLETTAEDTTNRPPPHLRRTPASAMSKKPATLAEIRETLSFLTETPEYDSFHEDASIDEDDHAEEDHSNAESAEDTQPEHAETQPEFAVPGHPRRTRGPVVDRLALLRQASSNSASGTTSGSGNSKLAFHGGSGDGPIGFRPPQLLRRVTSGSSSSSGSSTSNRVIKPAASGPKKGGAVNSYTAAREQEREKQLRMKQRNGGSNIAKLLSRHSGGGLGGLAGKGQWD